MSDGSNLGSRASRPLDLPSGQDARIPGADSNLGSRASRPQDLPSGQDARAPRVLLLLLMAVGFALAHTQSPLFFSNQNQYLLHGLADAGYGHLSHDWLASSQRCSAR